MYVGVGIATRSQSELAPRVAGARKEPAAEDAAIAEFGNSDMPPMMETHGLASLPRFSVLNWGGEVPIRSKWQCVITNTYSLFPSLFSGFPAFWATGTVSMNSRSVIVSLSGFRADPVSMMTIILS